MLKKFLLIGLCIVAAIIILSIDWSLQEGVIEASWRDVIVVQFTGEQAEWAAKVLALAWSILKIAPTASNFARFIFRRHR